MSAARQGQELGLENVEPWEEPVDGRGLVRDLEQALTRYVGFPDGGALVVGLWCVMSYLVDRLDLMPRLLFSSPVRGCGKTKALRLVGALANRPVESASMSPAALFRLIEKAQPTVLLDEIDQAGLNAEENSEMRRLLNAGHSRGAMVYRTVGKDFETRGFNVFAAIALAGIGRLPDTIESRSIRVPMRRLAPGERVERLRESRIGDELLPLRRRIARWALDHGPAIETADPEPPKGLEDRDADNAEPLCAIGDEIGVGDAVRAALLWLRGGGDVDEQNAPLMMLSDLRTALEDHDGEIATQAFREYLIGLEERPWSTWTRGGPISFNKIAALLRGFEIRPRNLRTGTSVAKGYALDPPMEEAFARYFKSEVVAGNEALHGESATSPEPRQWRAVAAVADVAPLGNKREEGPPSERPVCGPCGYQMVRLSSADPWRCSSCGEEVAS